MFLGERFFVLPQSVTGEDQMNIHSAYIAVIYFEQFLFCFKITHYLSSFNRDALPFSLRR